MEDTEVGKREAQTEVLGADGQRVRVAAIRVPARHRLPCVPLTAGAVRARNLPGGEVSASGCLGGYVQPQLMTQLRWPVGTSQTTTTGGKNKVSGDQHSYALRLYFQRRYHTQF